MKLMGVNHRIVAQFRHLGYGFVPALPWRLWAATHPVGVVMASLILFGALYQGGAELAFEMPKITRDMVIAIQGLIILFSGALEHLCSERPSSASERLWFYFAIPTNHERGKRGGRQIT